MKRTHLTILNAGIAFIMAFILSQFTSIIGVSITEFIFSACGKTATQIETFWNTSVGYLLQALYMNLAFVGIFVWYYKSIGKQNIINKPDKSTYKYFSICLIIGIVSMFLLSGTLNYFNLILDKIGISVSNPDIPLNSIGDYLVCIISLAVIPAICEEILFRGVLINTLKHKGHIFAIVASAIMFAIFHFSPLQLIYPICFGLILGIIYLRTQNIIFPIIIHFINNALSLTIQYFSKSSGEFTHSTFMLIYSIVTLVLWIIIICWMFKDFNKYKTSKLDNQNIVQTTETNNKNLNTQNTSNDKLSNWVFYGSIILMLCIYILLLTI